MRWQGDGHNMSGKGYFGTEARKIFDLFIYRCTEQKYWAEQKEDRTTYIKNFGFDPLSRESYIINMGQRWFEKHGGEWALNEAVGLITLFASPYKIGGLFYFVNRRIMKRMTQKRVFFRGKLFEFNIWPNDDSETIYRCLRHRLSDSVAEVRSLRGRVIDFEPLDTLGPHINWAEITHKRREKPSSLRPRGSSRFPPLMETEAVQLG
jgi:hypothetical protein